MQKILYCTSTYRFCILVYIIFWWLTSSAGGEPVTKLYNLHFERISLPDGQTQSEVNCIQMDHYGFIWFGTQDGLNRYNGYDIKSYKPEINNSYSISNNTINTIYNDSQGVLWIGTKEGLNKFNYRQEKFTHFYPNSTDSANTNQNNITKIIEDFYGILWVGTENGIYQFYEESKSFAKIKLLIPDNQANPIISTIFEDAQNRLWVGTHGNGLFLYNRRTNIFEPFALVIKTVDSVETKDINCLYQDKKEQFWAGTTKGLLLINPENGETSRFTASSDFFNNIIHNNITSIFEDNSGNLWTGSNGGGLDIFNQENKSFTHFHKNYTQNSISDNRVKLCYFDKNNILWMATSGGSIDKVNFGSKKFSNYTVEPYNLNSLSDNIVWSIFKDKTGNLWIGTDSGGLTRIDTLGIFKHFKHDPQNPSSINSNKIWCIHQDNDGFLWIGTDKGFLEKFNPKTEKFTHIIPKHTNTGKNSEILVWYIYQDNNGIFWLGTGGSGLIRYNPKDNSLISYTHHTNNPISLSHDKINMIIEPYPDELWLATDDGGLSIFNKTAESFTNYLKNPKNINGLSSNSILSFYQDKEKNVWIGTWGGGINKYDKNDYKIHHYQSEELLSNEIVYSIQSDNNENLWLSTNRGIVKFNTKTKTGKLYSIHDGLQSNEFNAGASFKDENGKLFFGGVRGFTSFYPDSIKDNPHQPQIVILDFQIFNKSVGIGDLNDGKTVLTHSILETDTLRLSYTDRVITFEFAALDYTAPGKNQYAYKMEGMDKNWNYIGNRRFATYTNIQPGEYIFRVNGSNNDGVWNTNGKSITILVSPPFWKNKYFILTITALLLLGLYFLYTYNIRAIRKRNLGLERINAHLNNEISEREKTEKELSEQKKFLDEIFNGISEGICIVNPNEIVDYCNQAFSTIFEFDINVIIGLSILDFFPNDSHQFLRNETNKRKEGISSTYELPYITPSGKSKYLRLMISPHISSDGVFKGSIGAILDITDQKNAEEKRRLSESRLRQAQRMETIGTLAGGIAHDFNNILVPIIGYTEMSIDLLPEDSIVKENLDRILKASKRAKDLIKQILSFSRQDNSEFRQTEIHPIVYEVLKLVRSSMPATIDILQDINENCGSIFADPTQIHQLVMNLCTNAYQAMRLEGGTLFISLYPVIIDQSLTLKNKNLQNGKMYICLNIKDTGEGMDKTTLERIFEPFFTTKRVGEGTGLGLAAVHGIVLNHGGEIIVESEKGLGTSFSIFFPQTGSQIKDHNKKVLYPLPKGHEHILFVDDEEDIVSLYKQILESLGYKVTAYSDSQLILKHFSDNPFNYDLLITDQTMPHLTGAELAREVLKIRANFPIILCTGYSENMTSQKAKEIGIKEFILKPLTMTVIASAIRKLLDHKNGN